MSIAGIVVVSVLLLVVIGLLALPVLLWQNTRLANLETEVSGVAAEARLGSRQSSHRAETAQILGGLWASALAAGVVVAIVVTLFGSDIAEDTPGLRWGLGVPAVLLATAVCLYLLYRAITAAGNRIHLFDEGLVHLHPTEQARAFRWDSVELRGGIAQHVTSHGPLLDRSLRLDPHITVRRPDTAVTTISKDSITDGAELISTIEDRVARAQLPDMIRKINEGHRLQFGPFSVDRDGVTADDTTVRWPEVTGFMFVKVMGVGGISLAHSESGAAGSALDDEVPNLALLVTLVDELRSSRPTG